MYPYTQQNAKVAGGRAHNSVSTVLPMAGAPPAAMANPMPEPAQLSVNSRFGPPVYCRGWYATSSANFGATSRSPRLTRYARAPPGAPASPSPSQIASSSAPTALNVHNIKPLGRVTKRRKVVTTDVNQGAAIVRSGMQGRPAFPMPQRSTYTPMTPSPESYQGLQMLANCMPSSILTPASPYSVAKPHFSRCQVEKTPCLKTSSENKSAIDNINVADLFAKLVANGIVKEVEDKTVVPRVDFLKPETLRVKQPALVAQLYAGRQCSSCDTRFPPEHTVQYTQHLDWHFRQNTRERDSKKRALSRPWYYGVSDWKQFKEQEDAEEKEKSWFDTNKSETEASAAPAEAPSTAAGALGDAHCALCGDLFQQFFHQDKEEWHLRNAVRFKEAYYHPVCLEDYKVSLIKLLEKKEYLDADDADDETALSAVELVEPKSEPLTPPIQNYGDNLLDGGDKDDVVLKSEPVVKVIVIDDDTDDESPA